MGLIGRCVASFGADVVLSIGSSWASLSACSHRWRAMSRSLSLIFVSPTLWVWNGMKPRANMNVWKGEGSTSCRGFRSMTYSQGCFKMPVGLLVRDVPSQQPIWGVVSCTCLWEDCNMSHVHVATYSGGAGLLEWLLSPRFKASLPAIELSWIVNVLVQTVLR